jgi:hypothetical protein
MFATLGRPGNNNKLVPMRPPRPVPDSGPVLSLFIVGDLGLWLLSTAGGVAWVHMGCQEYILWTPRVLMGELPARWLVL